MQLNLHKQLLIQLISRTRPKAHALAEHSAGLQRMVVEHDQLSGERADEMEVLKILICVIPVIIMLFLTTQKRWFQGFKCLVHMKICSIIV